MGSTVFNKVQYGKETSNGTPVAADTILLCEHPPLNPDRVPVFPEENLGVRAASMRSYIGQKLVTNTIRFPNVYYQALPVVFSMGLKGGVTPTVDSDSAAWAFAPSMTASNSLDSLTLEFGDDTQAWEVEYAMAERIALSGTVNQGAEASPVELSIDYFGRQYTKTTFTALDLTSDIPSGINDLNAKTAKLYIDNTWAGVGSTEVQILRGFEIEILTGVHPKFFSTSDQFFTTHGEGIFSILANFTFEGTSDAVDVYDDFTAQNLVVARLEFLGNAISDSGTQTLQIDIGGKYEAVTPISESDNGNNLYTATLRGLYDTTGAKMLDVNVITNVAAI